MTYLELLEEWFQHGKATGELVDVKTFPGDGCADATPEQRAEAMCDILTAPSQLLDTSDL